VWIGANAIILCGVTVGEGCIIASGSVVTKDCYPNGMYAGVPAKRIKDLDVTEYNKIINNSQ
jgi:acetyltransferase-like isoleucine patch superfamily enzyme